MKFIKKKSEPQDFKEWKKTIGEPGNKGEWVDLKNPEKDSLQSNLLNEQGYICCYCGNRIELQDSHIEHLKPQSKYHELRFEYRNLLASCNGGKRIRCSVHCGRKKDKWFDEDLFITPLNPSCSEFFRFSSEGEIKPSDNPDKQKPALETISKLGLNHTILIALRRNALNGIFDDFDSLSNEDLEKLIENYRNTDSKGKYEPFCAVIEYVLTQYISGSNSNNSTER
ncbi:MAG: retron system putative HNH endonuclease [Candidatus Latescibacter sp.]|nr:retron system putative HNH endonuclease [Candidatus Latescibacter sp.]